MEQNKFEELHKSIYRFFRDNNIDKEEMAKFLKGEFAQFAMTDAEYDRGYHISLPGFEEPVKTAVDDFWHSLVQQTIDFINNNPEIKQMLETRQNIKDKEWNGAKSGTDAMRMIPDFRVYFGVDGLESSLECKEWTPATDSYLTFGVGNEPVIDCH